MTKLVERAPRSHAPNGVIKIIATTDGLVYLNELTLYRLIPKPICKLTNCVYIKPNHNFQAISKTKELYSTYEQFHYSACEAAPNYPRSTRPICEIQLLQDPAEVPENYSIRQVRMNTTIFY